MDSSTAPRARTRGLLAAAACVLLPLLAACSATAAAPPAPWHAPGAWARHAIWYDGKAERCVYDATRTIYGLPRQYVATAYTNKQRMDPTTTTKSATDQGVEVFKHHWSERIPTENYDYDFSTATFSRTDDLALFKLSVGTQEDCGSSFKTVWRRKGRLRWLESVYFPGAGLHRGTVAGDPLAEDALSLVLRDFPFPAADGPKDGPKDGPAPEVRLQVLPSQKDTHRVPFDPVAMVARLVGRETLDLPAGSIDAWEVALIESASGNVRARYWFAADGGAPWLHALVRYEGPQGQTYRLHSLERTAYWVR